MPKRLFQYLLLLVCLTLPWAAVAQDATPEATEPVSPIPGAECNPDVEPSGEPIVVGGSLSLTGALAATANVHRITGEIFVEMVNECGGLLGRPLEWRLEDDASSPDQAAAIYERLITVDQVDLLIGPYAAANILAVAAVVERYDKLYVTHTNGRPDIEITDYHFPSWQVDMPTLESNPWTGISSLLWDTLLEVENPPTNVFYAVNKFPTTAVLGAGARAEAEARGLETLDYVEYDFGTTDFSAIANRIVAADPDFIYLSAVGIDANNLYDAFDTLGYSPRGIFVALNAPGPLTALGEAAENVFAMSIFEEHAPFTDNPIVPEFIERYRAAATEAQLYPIVETQAAASFSAWQILTAAVVATESLDDTVLRDWLVTASFETIAGTVEFDGINHFGIDFNRLMQIQGGKRLIVAPAEFAAPDAVAIYPND